MADTPPPTPGRRDILDALIPAKTGLSFDRLTTVTQAGDRDLHSTLAVLLAQQLIREEFCYDGTSTIPRLRYRLVESSARAA
jgi:hypothetical protein